MESQIPTLQSATLSNLSIFVNFEKGSVTPTALASGQGCTLLIGQNGSTELSKESNLMRKIGEY